MLDNLYNYFHELEELEFFTTKVVSFIFDSIKISGGSVFTNITIDQILNNLKSLISNPKTLKEIRDKIRSDIEAKKVVPFDLARKRKRK